MRSFRNVSWVAIVAVAISALEILNMSYQNSPLSFSPLRQSKRGNYFSHFRLFMIEKKNETILIAMKNKKETS